MQAIQRMGIYEVKQGLLKNKDRRTGEVEEDYL